MTDRTNQRAILTPTRVLILSALVVLLLAGAVFVVWASGPQMLTLEVSQPVGKTVLCHFVVDGEAESREDVAPVTYRFDANELRYAIICLDPASPNDVSVLIHDRRGTGGSVTASGVTGVYQSRWRGNAASMGSMTSTHVATMRASAIAGQNFNDGAAAP